MVGGNLVLASSKGQAVLVSPTTGKTEKEINLGAPIYIPPVAANGSVYFVTNDAKLIVLH